MSSPKKPEKPKPVDQPAETPESHAGDYEVGYGRPPKHTQFKKGQSGNPSGRKPDSKNLRTIFERVLFEPVKVKENGKIRRLPAIEACAMNLRTQALKGDGKALDRCIRLMTIVDRVAPADDGPGRETVDAETDKALLEELRRMLQSDETVGIDLEIDADNDEEDRS